MEDVPPYDNREDIVGEAKSCYNRIWSSALAAAVDCGSDNWFGLQFDYKRKSCFFDIDVVNQALKIAISRGNFRSILEITSSFEITKCTPGMLEACLEKEENGDVLSFLTDHGFIKTKKVEDLRLKLFSLLCDENKEQQKIVDWGIDILSRLRKRYFQGANIKMIEGRLYPILKTKWLESDAEELELQNLNRQRYKALSKKRNRTKEEQQEFQEINTSLYEYLNKKTDKTSKDCKEMEALLKDRQ